MKKIYFLILIIFMFSFQSYLICEWKQIVESDFGEVESINCPDSNNCFALVNHPSTPVLYKSTDHGLSWYLIYEDNIKRDPSVNGGLSPHANYYFITDDDYCTIRKSSDGGLTFKEIQIDLENSYLRAFAMYDTNYGFVANGYNYFTTKNGWETFKKYPKLSREQVYYSPIFVDSNTVVMTYVANIRWNDSKGFAFVKFSLNENKWDTISYFGRDSNNWIDAVKSLYFVNDTLGFGCGTRNDSTHDGNYYDIIYRTTNGGNNWELIHKEYKYPQIGFYNNIAFYDENNGVAVGFYGKIAMTNDGGETWIYEPTPNAMDNARKMLVCWAGRTPLIGTWDAGIFRYEGDFFKFKDTTGVDELRITNYELRIMPNPAGEYIEINVDGRQETANGRQEIQIYNIYGQCVLSVWANGRSPVQIDVSQLPVGMYFVRFGEKMINFVKY